jgi:hypothetical protein
MSASAGCQLLGKWRIIEADTWDCDYLDLVQPAYIVFGKNGRGEFAFGAIEATLELEYAPRIVFFNWTGFDEGDEVSGSGSAELTEDDDSIRQIELSFHNGRAVGRRADSNFFNSLSLMFAFKGSGAIIRVRWGGRR